MATQSGPLTRLNTTSGTFRFLPREIRDKIYHDAFSQDDTSLIFSRNYLGHTLPPVQLRYPNQAPFLLQALSNEPELYAEALQAFELSKRTYTLCEENEFSFGDLPDRFIKTIRYLRIEVPRLEDVDRLDRTYESAEPWRQIFAYIVEDPKFKVCEPRVVTIDTHLPFDWTPGWFTGTLHSLRPDTGGDDTFGEALIDICEVYNRPNNFEGQRLEKILIEVKEYRHYLQYVYNDEKLRSVLRLGNRALGCRGVIDQLVVREVFDPPIPGIGFNETRTLIWDLTED